MPFADSPQAPAPSDASAFTAFRAEAHALAKQAWRMSKRAFQLQRFRAQWQRHQARLKTASADELRAEQYLRLRHMLAFAGSTIPYYQELFTGAGLSPRAAGFEDLHRLPLLTRERIRRNFPDRLVHPAKRFASWMLGRTSGSTSDSLSFVRPDERFRRSLYYSVLLRTAGRTDVQVFVLSTPICTPNTCSLRPNTEEGHRELARRLHRVGPIRHLGGMVGLPSSAHNILTAPDTTFEEIRLQLEDGAPSVIIADPVYLGAFARSLQRSGRPVPRLDAIISTYELLTPSITDLLKGTFGCPISTQYGSSEINDIADECEAGRLHVRMDEVLVETLRDGQPAAPGELARVVVTDLGNFNMPLIRYDIGDVVRVEEGPCDCGRRSQLLGTVEGRSSDLLQLADRLVTPLAADALFRHIPDLAAYRLEQTRDTSCRVSLMGARGSAGGGLDLESARRTIEQRSPQVLGDAVRVRVREVEEIEPEASNKFRFVYSHLGPSPEAEPVRAL